jgi:glutathione S-transferase
LSIWRREGEPDETAVADAKAALMREFALMEAALQGPFAAGLTPSAADFALYPLTAVFARVAAKRPQYALDAIVPEGIAGWKRRAETLSYFDKTIPPHWRST